MPAPGAFGYMFRRYSPPTSYNEWDICPSDTNFTVSTCEAKMFFRSRAVCCN